jgi:hypothetical protein
VFVVEGEKDVDNLAKIGIAATCNHGGAGKGKWKPAVHGVHLKGAYVIVVPDNDQPGRDHATWIAQSGRPRGGIEGDGSLIAHQERMDGHVLQVSPRLRPEYDQVMGGLRAQARQERHARLRATHVQRAVGRTDAR